jgi:arylsulfatase A-like enzyme
MKTVLLITACTHLPFLAGYCTAQSVATANASPESGGWSATRTAGFVAPVPITVILLDDIDYLTWETTDKPHLDLLAARGVYFKQAWGYPVCSPARAALLTGRHAWRTGVGNLVSATQPYDGLPLQETTIAELVREPVQMFGKWHLGDYPTHPRLQGFDSYEGAMGNVSHPYWGYGYFDWTELRHGLRHSMSTYVTLEETNDALASSATLRVIAYHAIHSPIHNPPGGTASDALGKKREMLAYIDRQIGRLMEEYDGWVFVINDNNNSGGKGTVLQSGVRVPFIVSGPGIDPGMLGTASGDLVSIVDVFATIAEIRGISYGPGVGDDSISLMPILQGLPGQRRFNYVTRFKPNHSQPGARTLWVQAAHGRDVGAFHGNYKLIRDEIAGSEDLYKMPGEVLIPPPWTGNDLVAADILRNQLR